MLGKGSHRSYISPGGKRIIWQERAEDVRGRGMPAGHWLPEEIPVQLVKEIKAFIGGRPGN